MKNIVSTTGCRALDELFGGGIASGLLTDIYGPAGSAKSQICYSIAYNYIKKSNHPVLFIDTTGAFRPERVLEISGNDWRILNKIIVIRVFSTAEQLGVIKKISELESPLVIIDSATSLYSYELTGAARHLAIMKFLHEISLTCIIKDCPAVMTNMVRDIISDKLPTISDTSRTSVKEINIIEKKEMTNQSNILENRNYFQREFMEASISLYAPLRIKVQGIRPYNGIFQAIRITPPREEPEFFKVTSRGIIDL